ncbi:MULTISPECIES: nucleoside deaminase [Pacificibacter]|uniref:nucleoside deaminase n=1 Tax=Pacificibacter TaxID=1042323 RepID=UPI001C08EE55|nr:MULTISPECIES: nucleoside deaminase [Pacificibacter]MBU2935156.1 nucleoside deaminase [Pacificibacter marinus]MDO6615947.1 nucleoside deaminase [Pacificibacter sp. 1_MG-2023]
MTADIHIFDDTRDEEFMHLAIGVAAKSREAGDHPFGAILVGPDGAVLIEQGNAFSAHGSDMTAHAERVLATRASQTYSAKFLNSCTMFTSAEPCAMCAGAAYWAGIGRIVYGQSEAALKDLTGDHSENPTLDMPCREVLASGQRVVVVKGPFLADEASKLQEGFWMTADRGL